MQMFKIEKLIRQAGGGGREREDCSRNGVLGSNCHSTDGTESYPGSSPSLDKCEHSGSPQGGLCTRKTSRLARLIRSFLRLTGWHSALFISFLGSLLCESNPYSP